ncbi:hypothetical protein B0T19DRAFT_474132 [Cercophora scortea]|uniref:Uncharacterized protein n=1 Tax=Cercophora scortea TaxID=314031 RepID=A0AAE0IZK6_9PEZI|nr:hypothetical protein B0T19DRAFT_474132 [Cercophora scortea]
MSSEPVFRRVGRGGAGNWYSKQDVEDAEKKTQAADLEGQKGKQADAPLTAAITAATVASTAATTYARGGRGGAGNFASPTAVSGMDASTTQHEREQDTERTKAAVAASKPRTGGLSGRGGVGNWKDSAASAGETTPQKVEQERKKLEEMELEVLKNVEAGLAVPRPAYQKVDRDASGS